LDNEDNASSEEGNKQSEPLITKIHSSRTHVSTDHLLEYRLEIAPAQLVRLVEGGIKGTRVQPEIDDIYADDGDGDEDGFDGDSDDEEGMGGKKKQKRAKKPPPDPDSHLRVWMPACMVKLVEPGLVEEYEETLKKREEKKAGKGKGKKTSKQPTKKGKVVAWFDEPSDEDIGAKKSTVKSKPKAPAASKKSRVKTKGYVDVSDEDSMDSDNVRNNLKAYLAVTKPNAPLKTDRPIAECASASEPSGSKSQPKAKSKPPPIPHIPLYDSDSSSSSEAAILGTPARPKTKSKSSPAVMRISDILSPASSVPAHKSTKAAEPGPIRMEPRPFPMPVDDYDNHDYVDNDFDFNFALWNANGDEDVGMNANMNDDPFLDVDRHPEPPISPTPSPPKQGRKKLSQPSSDTGTESYGARTKKSPRKSKNHTSPKHSPVRSNRREWDSDSEFEDTARPGSPSPVRPRPKAVSSTTKRMPTIAKKYVAPPKVDDTLIEISSGDDTPPPAKAMRPPLLISKSRNYVKGTKSVIKIQTKSVLATSDINSLPTYDNDIIDLT
jgi:holliday junction resolvase YEN1